VQSTLARPLGIQDLMRRKDSVIEQQVRTLHSRTGTLLPIAFFGCDPTPTARALRTKKAIGNNVPARGGSASGRTWARGRPPRRRRRPARAW
jgi:hypothetical protein